MNSLSEKKTSTKHKAIFTSIFINYIVISIAILAITISGYILCHHILKNNLVNSAIQQSSIITNQIEHQISTIQQSVASLSQNSIISETVFTAQKSQNINTLDMLDLQKMLAAACIQNSSCQDILIYFENDYIVSGTYRNFSPKLLDIFCSKYNISADDFHKIIQDTNLYNWKVFDNGSIWFMQSSFNKYFMRDYIVIAEFKVNDILYFIDESYQNNAILIRTDSTKLFSSKNLPDEDYNRLLEIKENGQMSSINNEEYIWTTSIIPTINWTCMIGIPYTEIFHDLLLFRKLLSIELIINAFIIIYMSWKFTTKSYQPLKYIADILPSDENNTQEQSDLSYENLYSRLNAVIKKNQSMTITLQKNEHQIVLCCLQQVFSGDIKEPSAITNLLGNCGINTLSSYYMLVLIRLIDNQGILAQDTNSEHSDLKYFTLKNILDEVLFSTYNGFIVKDGEDFVVLLTVDNDGYFASIRSILSEIHSFLNFRMHIQPYFIMCHRPVDFSLLSHDLRVLKQELTWHTFWMDAENVQTLWYLDELDEENKDLSYTQYLRVFKKLLNFLDAKDYPGAYKALDYILTFTFSKDRSQMRHNIYRMHGLIEVMIMSLDIRSSGKDTDFFTSLNYKSRLLNVDNINQLRQVCKELFNQIIAYDKDSTKELLPERIQNIIDYIQNNYIDANLNVSMIAEHFDISVPHLSRSFKGCMECGILDYIHHVRLKKAKELIAAGENLNSVAIATGFLDSKALTRTFKKYEGITPSQYRRLRNQE